MLYSLLPNLSISDAKDNKFLSIKALGFDMDASVIIGSIGVSLLLLAFFLNLFKILKQDTKIYTIINIIGAGMSCYASFMTNCIPFVILEGIWSIVAIIGLIIILRKKK